MMKNKIRIEDLHVEAIIGVLPQERITPQKLLLTLEFVTHTPTQDNITTVVDYAKIAAYITEYVSNSQYQLLEFLADQLLQAIQQQFSIQILYLQITKPNAIANAKSVKIIGEQE